MTWFCKVAKVTINNTNLHYTIFSLISCEITKVFLEHFGGKMLWKNEQTDTFLKIPRNKWKQSQVLSLAGNIFSVRCV